MADLLTIEALFTLFMLILLQAVLGFDNLLYIAIESNKVGDPQDAKKVRKYGIGIAVLLRIILLFVIVKIFALLAEPLFGVHFKGFIEGEFTAQALITLIGGAFIIYTAIKEIHHLLQVDHIEHSEGSGTLTAVSQIVSAHSLPTLWPAPWNVRCLKLTKYRLWLLLFCFRVWR